MLRFILDSYKYCNDMKEDRYIFFIVAVLANMLFILFAVTLFVTFTFEFQWVAVRLAAILNAFQIAPMIVYYIHLRRQDENK